MRFAWLRKKVGDFTPVKQGCTHPLALIRLAYNIVFWVFLLPFVTTIDYATGFVAFTIVIAARLSTNLYLNNILKPTLEQFERFPFHI